VKNSGFRQQSLEEVKAKQAVKRAKYLLVPMKPRKYALSSKTTATGKKSGKNNKGKSLPNWLKAIPESQSHGSGTFQKRLWRLTSDYVRIRDFYAYGCCVATGKRFETWKESHAGHLKPYSTCNALFKFDIRNIHAQHGNSNKWGNFDTFRDFEKVVRNRGYDFDAFERQNRQAQGASLRDSEVLEEIKKRLILMKKLPEKPEYFERALALLHTL